MLDNNGPPSTKPRRPRRWIFPVLALVLLLLAAWVLNASRPGSRVEGCPEGCATWTLRGEGPLRVLSLNMLHGFPRFKHLDDRLDLIAAEIQRLDPDVVCLQEVPWHWGLAAEDLAERTGLNHLFLRANGNRWAIFFEEGEAILSRYPLRDAAAAELDPSPGPFEHRVALQATAVTPWGDLRIVSTHLTNGAPEVNQGQAASLIAVVQAGSTQVLPAAGSPPVLPAIVTGDFNARPDSLQIQALLAAGWIDTFRAAHPNEHGLTCCSDDLTDPDQALDQRIDYIFLVPGDQSLTVAGSRVVFDRPVETGAGWLWPSDHAGLLTTLSAAP